MEFAARSYTVITVPRIRGTVHLEAQIPADVGQGAILPCNNDKAAALLPKSVAVNMMGGPATRPVLLRPAYRS